MPSKPLQWPKARVKVPAVKSLTEHLWFEVKGRRGFVNITSTVEELVRKSAVREGLCLVNEMHITGTFDPKRGKGG